MSKLLFCLQLCGAFAIGWFSMDFFRYVILNGNLFYLVSLIPIIGASSFLYASFIYEKRKNAENIKGR
jgi:hypothetical protein